MKFMLVIKYDGSKFYGFQRQKNKRNVQGEIEAALSEVYEESIVIKGAGRTDKGVHALGQVVHFEASKNIKHLKSKLNSKLKDIYVKKVKVVSYDFHARFSVKSKRYMYKLATKGNVDSNYFGIETRPLNIKMMRDAAKIMLGTHDFRNFVSGKREDYVTTITSIKIIKFNNIIYFIFDGVGFYRYMIRSLVGALVSVGLSKATSQDISGMLNNYEIDKRLPVIAPSGLYLCKIKY